MSSSKFIIFGRRHLQILWIYNCSINMLTYVWPNEANSKRKIENRSINGKVIAIFNVDHEIARLYLWVKREPTFDILSFAQFLTYRNRLHHFGIVRSSGTKFKSYNISKFWRKNGEKWEKPKNRPKKWPIFDARFFLFLAVAHVRIGSQRRYTPF